MATYAFTEDKLLVETYSKTEIDAALATKVSTTTYTQGMGQKANVNHSHNLASLSGTLPFSKVTGLAFALSGSDLYISMN